MKALLSFLLATGASLAQVALPSEAQRWEQSGKAWDLVVSHRPETLPVNTRPEVAANAINAAEKSRLAFLRGQRWLFCGQATKLGRWAAEWALAATGVHTPDPREPLADLDDRIAAIRQELERLTRSFSPGKPSDATLVYVAKLERQLEELMRLRSHLNDAAATFAAGAAHTEAAREAARSVAASFDRASAVFQELVEDSVREEGRWRHHHQLLRQSFGLRPAAGSHDVFPSGPEDWRSACAAVLLP